MGNTGRRLAVGIGVAAALTLTAAPAANADEPPPLINVPAEIIPYIGPLPAEWNKILSDWTNSINEGLEDLNRQYDAQVRGFSGGVGNIFCIISGFFGSPCAPPPPPGSSN